MRIIQPQTKFITHHTIQQCGRLHRRDSHLSGNELQL